MEPSKSHSSIGLAISLSLSLSLSLFLPLKFTLALYIYFISKLPIFSMHFLLNSLAMPATLLRIFLLHNVLNTILLYLVPKKLRPYLPTSWYPHHQTFPNINPSLDPSKTNPPPPPPPSQPPIPSSPLPRGHQKMEPAELRRVFQMFDRNGDGRITKTELTDSFENMGIFIPDAELSQMIEKIDVNGDGCVDIEEFGLLYGSMMDERNEEEDMKEAFKVFDKNGDGFITVEELRSVLSALGLRHGTAEDCKRMIAKVDVDGDGRVNFDEFRQMMRGGGFAALNS